MVVILCRFLAYSKKKSFTFAAIWGLDEADKFIHPLGTYLNWGQNRAPFVDKLREHAVRAALFHFAQATEDGKLVVCHTHVNLNERSALPFGVNPA